MNPSRFFLLFVLVTTVAGCAQTPTPAPWCVDPRATLSPEETRMFGRILSADEDLGGGYYSEARGKYERIVSDVEKGKFSPCFRWMAYDGYGQLLIATHKKKKAIAMLTRAVEEAKGLTAAQLSASQQHLESAEQMK
jgi:hypothetical protein